jgi:hypothetical protein
MYAESRLLRRVLCSLRSLGGSSTFGASTMTMSSLSMAYGSGTLRLFSLSVPLLPVKPMTLAALAATLFAPESSGGGEIIPLSSTAVE